MDRVSEVSGIGLTRSKRWRLDHAVPSNKRRDRKVKHPEIEDKLMQFITKKEVKIKLLQQNAKKKAKLIGKSLKIVGMKFTWGFWLNKRWVHNRRVRIPLTFY